MTFDKLKLKPNKKDIKKLKREIKDLVKNNFNFIDKEMVDILKLFIGRDDLFPIECCSSHPYDDNKTEEYKENGYLMIISKDEESRKILDKIIVKLLQRERMFHFQLVTEIDEAYESLEDYRPILVSTFRWSCMDEIVRDKLLVDLKEVISQTFKEIDKGRNKNDGTR